ncbi:MAG: RNA polymerase sigma factor [Bacteroidetes bacterium]|nr:RNA polymerase sigma factor [Bacteroidota bacterium]
MEPDSVYINEFLKNKNQKAFTELMKRYQDKVFRFCVAYSGNKADAEDLAQEIFIKVFHNLGNFRSESLFGTWLYRIMINHCHNTYNSKRFRFRKLIQENSTIPDKGSDDPESLVIAREKTKMIYEGLSLLEGNQRSVLILRDIDGLTYEEISELLHLKSGTVKSTLARARIKVANYLKRRLYYELP